jgi:hypothetical protein
LGYLYVLLKIYRVLCLTKITFDQLPLFNPYKWPLSSIRIITNPYFIFWSIILPPIRLGKTTYDISAIIGLEFLTTLIALSSQVRIFSLMELQKALISSAL